MQVRNAELCSSCSPSSSTVQSKEHVGLCYPQALRTLMESNSTAVQGSKIRPWATHHNSRDTMSRTFGLGLWSASSHEKWYKLELSVWHLFVSPKKIEQTHHFLNANKLFNIVQSCSIYHISLYIFHSHFISLHTTHVAPRNRWPDFAPSRKTSGRQGSCLRSSCFELFRSVSSVQWRVLWWV